MPKMIKLKLTHDEISVLRWLRDSHGEGAITGYALSGNKRFGVADRLIEAGYVNDQADPFNPITIHYRLTDSGREALGLSGG
jgi:DNA-binding MarR family transcriptional regulator